MPNNYKAYEIDPQQLCDKMRCKESIAIIDVREPWEIDIVKFPEAISIPLEQLEEHQTFLKEKSKSKEIYILCHHGVRSLKAAVYLSSLGIPAKSISGGIDQWAKNIDLNLTTY